MNVNELFMKASSLNGLYIKKNCLKDNIHCEGLYFVMLFFFSVKEMGIQSNLFPKVFTVERF